MKQASTSTSQLGVMNFLNEVSFQYPAAVSFASGRPREEFFDVAGWIESIARFCEHDASTRHEDAASSLRRLAQYGPTNGVINALVAEQIGCDEGVVCSPERLIVTTGCQEAIALSLQALCADRGDTVLALNPTYIGVTGAAIGAGIELQPLDSDPGASLPALLARKTGALREQGKRARAFYVIPEFDNPTGTVITLDDRRAILEFCASNEIAILEDNTYRMFRFEGDARPTLAELDEYGCVVYLHTYSKTLCPAVRVGCAVVPKTLFGDAAASRNLLASMSENKSFLTVNTSQFNQALVGGVLLAENGSLQRLTRPATGFYRANRDTLVECLETHFGSESEGVSWNRPEGGFFLTLELPFEFAAPEMMECASEYGAIVMPMSFFSLDGSYRNRVRFAYSNLSGDEIRRGIERFAAYARAKIAGAAPCIA
jgi:(S)-3,5-dihydroxyphenylglycine transaminase